MTNPSRRRFIAAGGLGLLSFMVGDNCLRISPAEAKRQELPLSSLTVDQASLLERLGDALVPGAADSGLSYFLDQQLSVETEDCMLMLRYLNVPPPYKDFYTQSLTALETACQLLFHQTCGKLSATQMTQLIDALGSNSLPGWQGPPAAFFSFVLRSDASDVVYGTEAGFDRLGIPYMAHIRPRAPW